MTSIFVAKLDFSATEEQLKSLFEEHGRVNRVTIAKDRETSKPRGFAFVEMFDESEAEAAIKALDNYAINGRNIAVKKADDRASGGKPSGDNHSNRQNDRPYNRNNDRPREDRNTSNDYKSEYKKLDDTRPAGNKPAFNPEEVVPVKVDRKKEKDNRGGKDAPKKTKMDAYKKSGKGNRFFEDDDDDDLDMNYNRNRSSGWDDDDDDEDDDF